MELNEAIKKRFSVRKYLDKEVSRELVQKLLDAGHEAPSSCNLQAIEYIVIDDQAANQKLASIATKKMLWAPVNIIMAVDSRVTVARHSAVTGLGAAMQNISLRAVELGLATCPMAGFQNDQEIKKVLGIPDHLDLVVLLSVGYEDESQKVRVRENIKEFVHFNKFSKKDDYLAEASSEWSLYSMIKYRKRIGPVYRYGERYSLGVYSPDLYSFVSKYVSTSFNNGDINLLDIDTYDANFARGLENWPGTIHVSDYSNALLDSNKKSFSANGSLITDQNTIDTSKKYDVVTIVNKLEFNPDHISLLQSALEVVKSDGRIIISTLREPLLKKGMVNIRRYMNRMVFKKPVNIYEFNPYYKIGFHRNINESELVKILKKNNFSLRHKEVKTVNVGTIFSQTSTMYDFSKN